MATHPDPNHHVVLAMLGQRDGTPIGWTAVSAPLTWNHAQGLWDKLDKDRRAGVRVTGAGTRLPGHVLYFAVRGVSDPQWAELISLGYADARNSRGYPSQYGDRGRVKAAKVWAKAHGYKGHGGGWIYDAQDQVVCQGWDSLALWLQRRGDIALGDDSNWYVLDLPIKQVESLQAIRKARQEQAVQS
jgi:hypothetical protein